MRRIAHRGMNRQALENTMPAFELAFGASDGIELDVQLARCGAPVVFHDDSLHRIFGKPGAIEDYSAEELAKFEPRVSDEYRGPYEGWKPTADERIPLLTDVLAAVPDGFFVNVEIKAPKVRRRTPTAAVADVLSEITGNYLVSSFNPIELGRFSRLNDTPTAFLYEPQSNLVLRNGWPAAVLGLGGLAALHPNWKLVSADLVERAHARGWKVNVWTVNDPQIGAWLQRLGVDALISDTPDRLDVA